MVLLVAFVVLLICLIFIFGIIVPPFHAALIQNRINGKLRSVGSGFHLIARPVEHRVDEKSVQKLNIKFSLNAEAKNRDVVPMNISSEYSPDGSSLPQYLLFTPKQIEAAIIERLKALISVAVRVCENRDDVHDNVELIARKVLQAFKVAKSINGEKTPEQHYGIKLEDVMIADPELPEELAKAELEKEKMQELNKARGLEMNKMRAMARQMVKEAKDKFGQDLSYEEALRRVQIQFGKVKEDNIRYGLDKNTLNTVKEVINGFQKR